VAPPRWPVINHGRRWRTTRYVRRAAWRQREPHRHPLLRTDAAVIDYQLAQRRDVGASAAHSDVGPAVARTVMSASISARSGSGSPSRPCCAVLYLGWTARHSGRIRPDQPRGGGGVRSLTPTQRLSRSLPAWADRRMHGHGGTERGAAPAQHLIRRRRGRTLEEVRRPVRVHLCKFPNPKSQTLCFCVCMGNPASVFQVHETQTQTVLVCLYGKPNQRVLRYKRGTPGCAHHHVPAAHAHPERCLGASATHLQRSSSSGGGGQMRQMLHSRVWRAP
jgi:hypothetical protein